HRRRARERPRPRARHRAGSVRPGGAGGAHPARIAFRAKSPSGALAATGDRYPRPRVPACAPDSDVREGELMPEETTGRRALIVRGGWDGHHPVEATE